jgi:two-component sensor histidine kinase
MARSLDELSLAGAPEPPPASLVPDPAKVAAEVCHRAKNDFQTITNLMALAAPYARTADDLALAVEGRVGALSVCYSLVAGEGGRPRLDQVAEEVLRRLLWRHGAVAQVKRQVQDISLSLRLCSPLALWLHEIISNALIHGLERSSQPCLEVKAALELEGLVMSVTDNGPGLPEGFDLRRHCRLGLTVAQAVAANDLRGRLDLLQEGKGFQARLTVPTHEFTNLNRSAWP